MEKNTSSIVQLSIGLILDENIDANNEEQSQLDQEVIDKGLTASAGGFCNNNDLSTNSLTTLDDLLSDQETIINAYIDKSNNALFLETKFNNVILDSIKQKNKKDIEKCIIDYCLKNAGISFDDTTISSENISENQLHNINESENNIIIDNNCLEIQCDNNIHATSSAIIEEPKYIDGKLAVCGSCGLSSMDFNRCYRCKNKIENNPKTVPNKTTLLHRKSVIEQIENYYKTQLNNNDEMRIIKNECEAVVCSSTDSNNIDTAEAAEQSTSNCVGVDDNSLTKITEPTDKNNLEDNSNDSSTTSMINTDSTNINNTDKNTSKSNCSSDLSTAPIINIEQPKFVRGKVAVCNNCGYSSIDFNRCYYCEKKIKINPKIKKNINTKQQTKDMIFNIKSFYNYLPTFDDNLSKTNDNNKSNEIAHNSKVDDDVPSRLIPNIIKRSAGSVPLNVDNEKMKMTDKMFLKRKQNTFKYSSNINNKKMKKHIDYVDDEDEAKVNDDTTSSTNTESVSPTDTRVVSSTNAMNTCDIVTTTITKNLETSFTCTLIEIGTYQWIPKYSIIINIYGLLMSISSTKYKDGFKTISIDYKDIIKIKIYHDDSMPVLFIYTNERIRSKIISSLSSTDTKQHKKSDDKLMILQLKKLSAYSKNIFKKLSQKIDLFEEIHQNDAQALLNQNYNIKNI